MKKPFFLSSVFLLLLFSGTLRAQTASDFFYGDNYPIQWLGIDYSQVQLIGDFSQFAGQGAKDADDIRDAYFPAWNRLILNEPNKYDLKEFLRIRDLDININMIMKRNANADTRNMFTYNPDYFSRAEVKKIVDSYDIKDGEGLGFLFIAESLNKIDEEAFFHFVVINLKTKEVLISERLRGTPKGFGLRNYWAGAFYEILKNIDDRYYKIWRQKYR